MLDKLAFGRLELDFDPMTGISPLSEISIGVAWKGREARRAFMGHHHIERCDIALGPKCSEPALPAP